eukprot:1150705-Pelagomonas_calceolata.AAC.7
MGCEPLGLTPSGKLHTWLSWPTQDTPRPETLATLPHKNAWQLCSVSAAWEAVAGAAEKFATSFAGSSWPESSSLSSTLKLEVQTRQNLLLGQPSSGGLGCSGQSLGANIPQSFGFDFPKPATSGPRNSSSRHKLGQHTFVDALALSRVWGCPFWGFRSPAADLQLADEQMDLHNTNCDIIYNLCSYNGVMCTAI